MASEAHKKFQATIEAALEEYIREIDPDDSGVLADWVVGYTLNAWIDDSVRWQNRMISKIGSNPNGQAHLAQWSADCIAEDLLDGISMDEDEL